MEFFRKRGSKGGEEEKTNKGEKKVTYQEKKDQGKNKTSAPAKEGEKPPQKNSKPKFSKGKPQAAPSVRNAQSALRPGNNSGLGKQKEHPMVQFGPVLKEFLLSREMVNRGIAIEYDQSSDQFQITVSFKKVLANGVSTSDEFSLKIEEYLAQRKTLLKVKDDSSHYMVFVSKLIDRLGVDVTHAKPSVAVKSVENFILKHLSPVERAILALQDDDFDRIDTRKIPDIMKPSHAVIISAYGGMSSRSEFLVKTINTDGPVTDKEPPNWALSGVTGLSKGVLLETLKIQHVPQITAEQKLTINSLAASLFGVDPHSSSSLKSEGQEEDEVSNL
jgi:hypothetical protein